MERDIERHLVEAVKKAGGWAIKLPPTFIAGLPDRMVLLPLGRIIFVELKDEGQKPRKIQKAIHQKLQDLGFKVMVLDSKKGVDDFIRKELT